MRPVLTHEEKLAIRSAYIERTNELHTALSRKRKVLEAKLRVDNFSSEEKNKILEAFDTVFREFNEKINEIEAHNFLNHLPDNADVGEEYSRAFDECRIKEDQLVSTYKWLMQSFKSPVATAAVPQNTSTVSMGLFAGNAVVLESNAKGGCPVELPRQKTGMPPLSKRSQTPAPKGASTSGVKP